jgi:2-(1,2-epoxy-1,2-dihydrophenyl)acetyl-CoA isomerase
MLAEPVDAPTAERWGMIWKAIPDDFLMSEAVELIEQLANAPTQGLAMMKEAFNASGDHDLDAQLDMERDLQRRAGCTPDFAEGVKAFMEKRPANFTGKAE